MKHIFDHWRTSLGGLVMSILVALQPIIYGEGSFDFQRDYPKLILAAGIALTGFIMKDPSKKEQEDKSSDDIAA